MSAVVLLLLNISILQTRYGRIITNRTLTARSMPHFPLSSTERAGTRTCLHLQQLLQWQCGLRPILTKFRNSRTPSSNQIKTKLCKTSSPDYPCRRRSRLLQLPRDRIRKHVMKPPRLSTTVNPPSRTPPGLLRLLKHPRNHLTIITGIGTFLLCSRLRRSSPPNVTLASVPKLLQTLHWSRRACFRIFLLYRLPRQWTPTRTLATIPLGVARSLQVRGADPRMFSLIVAHQITAIDGHQEDSQISLDPTPTPRSPAVVHQVPKQPNQALMVLPSLSRSLLLR
jgi:hypothetical protein